MGQDYENTELCFIVMTTGAACAGVDAIWTGTLGHTEPISTSGAGNTLYYYYQSPGVYIECN